MTNKSGWPKARPTRFKELGYRQDGPRLWRIVDADTQSAIGVHYVTKAELLADLEGYAAEYGCVDGGWRETYTTEFDGVHLKVRRHDGKPIRCNWDTLYRIKTDAFGVDARVVEVFPPRDDLVDETNTRHLFLVAPGVLPRGLDGWACVAKKCLA